ncbi:MAG: ABC transporter permease [Candidatus Hodarchaeales archaeon]|jgi:ABC-type antimicrobial peptide transport system permease subunit
MTFNLPDPDFPIYEVLLLSFSNIRRRFFRSIITALGVILGIAFMAALLTNTILLGLMQKETTVEAYQWWLVGISLLVCFGGITNSMLMAVNERVKEIGVYKCIGGLNKHIVRLFIVEALLLGIVGGCIGGIAGIGIGIFMNLGSDSDLLFNTISDNVATIALMYLACLIVSIVLTVLATYIPANRAANLSPAEALRYEN